MDILCRHIENNQSKISNSIHALRLPCLCHIEKCGNENVENFNLTKKTRDNVMLSGNHKFFIGKVLSQVGVTVVPTNCHKTDRGSDCIC